jgi:RimJ/RimL family protein N-acetyltransferase
MIPPYEKIAFVWDEPRPPVEVPERLTFHSLKESDLVTLVTLIGHAMSTSLDRGDQQNARRHDPTEAARAFIAAAKEHFEYRLGWWQLAYDAQGRLVGFVQPVVYRDCQQGGLEEGTIYYIGVAPEHRGRGYIRDLLSRGTQVLQGIGVWRVYCDTDVVNAPMIAAFKAVGYEQFGEPQVKPL